MPALIVMLMGLLNFGKISSGSRPLEDFIDHFRVLREHMGELRLQFANLRRGGFPDELVQFLELRRASGGSIASMRSSTITSRAQAVSRSNSRTRTSVENATVVFLLRRITRRARGLPSIG